MNKKYFIFNLRISSNLILSAVFITLVIIAYTVTHLYLSATSKETMINWYSSQAVEIQEGNLLAAVTKIQRMKKSTNFIQGVLLFDLSLQKQGQLIAFGKEINSSKIPLQIKEILIKDSGFFEQYVMMPLPNNPNKILVLLIKSNFLKYFFLVLSFGLCILFIFFRKIILNIRNSEIRKRELLIKDSLNILLNFGESSLTLEKEHPALIKCWLQKKSEFDQAQLKLAETKTQVRFAQIAAKVAHDIRSPIGALRAIVFSKKFDIETLTLAADRLENITLDLIKNRVDAFSIKTNHTPNYSCNSQHLETSLIHLINEKKLLFGHFSEINFHLDLPSLLYEEISFDPKQLVRHLSNLIDNSVDAVESKGDIYLTSKRTDKFFIFEVKDNGTGISTELLDRFGELNITSKIGGSGMGIYFTKLFVSEHSGDFQVNTHSGQGTSIRISLP